MKIIERRTLAWIVNIALPVTTVVVLFMGYKAYTKLNTMVDTLEESAKPNYNLITLNELSFYINEMERNIDAYRVDSRSNHMRSFNTALDESLYLIDSLKETIDDNRVVGLYDSLSSLLGQWAKVQTQIGALNSDILESTLDDLTQKIAQLPETLAEDDTATIPEEKKRFLGRIFGKKKNQQHTTTRPSQSERLQKEILAELSNAKSQSSREGDALKNRLANLSQESAQLQNEIVSLINNLEAIEVEKDQQNVKNVELLAKATNQEIVVFSALTSILLLITIVTQVNYLARNRKYQQALRSAKRNAEELAHAKERFLANMSHEIRTPMNAIAGFTNQLLKSNMSPEQRDQLEVVKNSSDHLIHLLNDILDLSKLQANKVELEKELFDVRATLLEVIRIFEDKASAKGLKLKSEFEGVPKYVNGDPHRLRQMITNLVHNAIKYTDSGSITLSTSIQQKTDKQVTLKISVKDTGVGIPKEKQQKIFEEFEQAQASDQRQGTGLGLAITSMLVNLHGGSIDIDSKVDEGTEMILYLPYEIGEALTPKKDKAKTPQIHLKQLTILIADDEPFNLKLLEAVFKSHEVELTLANDGQSALEALLSQPFDIAILDVKMPGMSGFEVVEQLRKNDGPNQKTPTLALTATISDQERLMSKKIGFDHIMRKPFDEAEFLEAVHQLTAQKTKTRNGIQHSQHMNGQSLYDLSTLKSIGDKDFVTEMVNTFKISAAKSIRNLYKAVDLKIRSSIKEEAHKMLPPARHLSANSLVSSIEKLQRMAEQASFEEINEQIKIVEEIYSQIKKDLESQV
ncbi:ATP-binding protein [Roseivirga sp. UBA1976]|uniref:ATP-binding protein n=1 Tax=Roseivirga sp. UBA1976 TaxID=1947386 RepID=UPI00257ABE11|nr:ATP-binding protein [Roseivirga sp. UBA1976]MEC7754436.1 ATP-binding protein [Bacteroidota bacterium]